MDRVRIFRSTLAFAMAASFLAACGGGGSSALATTSAGGGQTYTIGGNTTGLASGAFVVLDVNGQPQTLTQNGGFTTALALASGDTYSVTVATQPAGETCSVTNGSGTLAGSNVNNIQVACSADPTQTYTIGGNLTGLASGASVVLQNDGGDNLTVNANGSFTFATVLVNEAAYDVTVLTQPAGQTCGITQAAGTVQGANVTSVTVSCANNPPPTYTIGGSVTGLSTGAGLTLQDNGSDNLPLAANGSFTFSQTVGQGAAYAVTILTPPLQQTCSVTNGSGTASANVTNVRVVCAANAYRIGGNLSGLAAGTSVVLQDNGSDDLTLTNNGTFTFAQNVAAFNPYNVAVLTQPLHQVCTVTNHGGTAVANVTNVQAVCAPGPEFAYVANLNSNTVSQYIIGPGGTLIPMTPVTVPTSGAPQSVTVDPTGKFAYVANDDRSGTVSQYTIGAGGLLMPMNPTIVTTGSYPYAVTVDPTGKFAYVVNNNDNTVSQYTIGAGGMLTPMNPTTVATGFSPAFVTVDPTGKFAYVANYGDNTVSQYNIGTGGALSPMTPATVTTGNAPESITVDPTGKYAYVANIGSTSVSQYTIGAGGLLSPMAPATVTTGAYPNSVTVDPTGKYAYVANSGNGTVSQYTIGAGGLLSPMTPATVTAGSGSDSVTVDPSGQYAYVANYSAGTVSQFQIGVGGSLIPMTPATVPAGTNPVSIVVAQP